MKQIMQCIFWITIVTTSGRTQRGYSYSYQNPRSIIFPDTRTQGNYYHSRSRHADLQSDLQEPRRQRIQNRVSELRRTENGFRIQLSKRGAQEPDISSQVVFPGPTSKSRFEPEISEECQKQGYCERIPNYPNDQVKILTNKFGEELRRKIKSDELDTDNVQIAQRFGSEGFTFGLCNASESIITPDSLQDKNNQWWTLLQDREKNMTQGFRVEICKNRDGSCSKLITFPPGYTHKCNQKYAYRTVIVVEDNKAVGERALRLPTCCSCMITAPSF